MSGATAFGSYAAIKALLEHVWAPWVRQARREGWWPRSTVLGRLMVEGAGAGHASGPRPEEANHEAERIEAAVVRLTDVRLVRVVKLRHAQRYRVQEIAKRLRRSRRHVHELLDTAYRTLERDLGL